MTILLQRDAQSCKAVELDRESTERKPVNLRFRGELGKAHQDLTEPDARDDCRKFRISTPAQGAKRQEVYRDADKSGSHDSQRKNDGKRQVEDGYGEKPDHGAPHEDGAVREVEHMQDAENQGEPQGKEPIGRTDHDAVQELLKKYHEV